MNYIDTGAAVLDLLPEPHCILDAELQCIAINNSFADLLGGTHEQFIGQDAAFFWPEVSQLRWENQELPAEFRTRSGDTVLAKVAVYSGDFLLVRVLASFSHDQATKIFHAQRLETLGLLAGGVAHDFNNVLTGILGHLAYLRNVLPPAGNHVESVDSIEEGALRASSITQQIVKFSRLHPNENSSRVDLVELINRVCGLVKRAIPVEVNLRWSPPPQPMWIIASEAHLSQIVINLVVNARDAIKGTGAIDISVEHTCSPAEVERLFGDEPVAAAYGVLSVRDNGEGMTEEVLDRLFEPYFTTKKERGTGLGLATVHSIVKGLAGAIEVESRPGYGSEFRIILPVIEEDSVLEEADSGSGPIPGHGERVLVVDDEYAVRNVLGLSLNHLGYVVETAASGLEALEKFGEADGHFDLVILDLLMPGLSGEEVFNRLRRLKPEIRVLVVSGFSSEAVVQRILDSGGRDFIQKPFSIEVLSRKVRGCLSA